MARRRRYAGATSGWAPSSATLGTCTTLAALGSPGASVRGVDPVGPRARLCRSDDKLALGAAIDLRAGRSRLSRHSDARSGVPPQVNRVTARHWVPRAGAAFRCDRSPRAIPPRRRPRPTARTRGKVQGSPTGPGSRPAFRRGPAGPPGLGYAPGEALPLRQPGPVADGERPPNAQFLLRVAAARPAGRGDRTGGRHLGCGGPEPRAPPARGSVFPTYIATKNSGKFSKRAPAPPSKVSMICLCRGFDLRACSKIRRHMCSCFTSKVFYSNRLEPLQ